MSNEALNRRKAVNTLLCEQHEDEVFVVNRSEKGKENVKREKKLRELKKASQRWSSEKEKKGTKEFLPRTISSP